MNMDASRLWNTGYGKNGEHMMANNDKDNFVAARGRMMGRPRWCGHVLEGTSTLYDGGHGDEDSQIMDNGGRMGRMVRRR